jgi:hypothetical protein
VAAVWVDSQLHMVNEVYLVGVVPGSREWYDSCLAGVGVFSHAAEALFLKRCEANCPFVLFPCFKGVAGVASELGQGCSWYDTFVIQKIAVMGS